MDRVLVSGFSYDGTMQSYLTELNFTEAHAIFMSKFRMWPTKENYPGRWPGDECNICKLKDTDQHVFSCPGYVDLICGQFDYEVFFNQEFLRNTVKLKAVAEIVVKLIERMETVQSLNLA